MLGQAERILELKKLSRTETRMQSSSFVVSFTSGKGGTGKTFSAVNTAYNLSKMNFKVLLLDFDMNLANVHIMMDALPAFSLYDYFTNRCTIGDAINSYGENFHAIYGASGKAEHPKIDSEKLKSFLYLLDSKGYDFIIFDTPGGERKEIFDVITHSDLAVIVSTPEPTSVMDAYVMLKLMNSKMAQTKVEVIFNKCNSAEEGRAAFENLNKASTHFLKKEASLLGLINSGAEVNKSIMSQVILAEKNPSSEVSLQLQRIADDIAKFKQVANSKHQAGISSNNNAF